MLPTGSQAHEPYHQDAPLHFSHPLVTESPSPDTKLRLNYTVADQPAEGPEPHTTFHTGTLVGEYAFNKSVGIEGSIPYSIADRDGQPSVDHLNDVELGIKYANYALADHGFLIGGGLEVSLPTGSNSKQIGSGHTVEISPYLIAGYKVAAIELIGAVNFSIPANEHTANKTNWILEWHYSALYHANNSLEFLIEFDGESVYGGDEDGFKTVNITPGIKFRPLADHRLQVGAGVTLPLTREKEFRARPILSAFYHF